MTKYVQTNEHGYVTAIIAEPALLGLFGGCPKTVKLTDEEAPLYEIMLKEAQSRGNGLHIDEVISARKSGN
jgi:hypothetical protein